MPERSWMAGFAKRVSPPVPRQLLARGRTFPQFISAALAVGATQIIMLPALRTYTEIIVGATCSAGTATQTLALLARIGATTVGQAVATTAQLDNDGLTTRSIAANTPILFQLALWPDLTVPGFQCVGVTDGGLIILTSLAPTNANLSPAHVVTITTTTTQVTGPVELMINAGTNASVAFTLDFLRVIEYPAEEDTVV